MTTFNRRHVELWVEARDGAAAVNPVMHALLADLEAAGATTSVRVLEHELIDGGIAARFRPDLVLLKSATSLALSVAVADETVGVRFLNSARATLAAHDKAATAARLAAAGLPVPHTFLVAPPATVVDVPRVEEGGWVVKPVRGVHGRGVTLHDTLGAAQHVLAQDARGAGFVVDDGTRLLQRRVGSEMEADVKVYVAGETMFAGAKRFGRASYASDAIKEQSLDRRVEELVLAVGEVLGLRCFGVDLRFEGDEPSIIDANPFPGYRGFPDAVGALRAEIGRALERHP